MQGRSQELKRFASSLTADSWQCLRCGLIPCITAFCGVDVRPCKMVRNQYKVVFIFAQNLGLIIFGTQSKKTAGENHRPQLPPIVLYSFRRGCKPDREIPDAGIPTLALRFSSVTSGLRSTSGRHPQIPQPNLHPGNDNKNARWPACILVAGSLTHPRAARSPGPVSPIRYLPG